MKALSIKQPWAWAIAKGHKTIETRTWYTQYRGPLLIVASKQPDRFLLEQLVSDIGPDFIKHLQYGKAIAVAKLTDCRPMRTEDEKAAGCEVYDRAFSWFLKDVRAIEPFAVKGQLGLYDVKASFDYGN